MFLADLSMRYPLLRGKKPLLLLSVIGMALLLGIMAPRQPLLAIGAEIAILLTIGILSKPDIATMAVIGVLYTNAAVVAVRYHGVPDFVGSALPALLVIPLASYMIFRRGGLVITPVLPLIFLFMVVQVAGTLLSENIATSTNALTNFMIEGMGLYFLITNVVRTPAMLRRVIWVLLAAGTFMGLLSFYQDVTRTYSDNYWGFAQMSNAAFGTGAENVYGKVLQKRLAGPIGEQNRYAQIMLMLVPLGFFRFWGERSKFMRLLAAIATAFAALGVALTFSRGAAVAFVMVLVIMTFMRYIKPWQIGIIILAIALLFAAVPEYRGRLVSLQGLTSLTSSEGAGAGQEQADGSMLSRATEGLAALLVFIDHPVVGVGPGMFRYYYQDYAEYVGLRVLAADRQAHNLYLGLAAETGALGLLCFFLILYVALRDLHRTRKRWQHTRPELANMATAFMLAIITYLTTGVFLHFAFIRYFWLILALGGAANYIAAQEEQAPAAPSTALAVVPAPAVQPIGSRTSVPMGQE
ncbi:MAG: O-antigen ligase family protein [Roseiflexaceae bacterium]